MLRYRHSHIIWGKKRQQSLVSTDSVFDILMENVAIFQSFFNEFYRIFRAILRKFKNFRNMYFYGGSGALTNLLKCSRKINEDQ